MKRTWRQRRNIRVPKWVYLPLLLFIGVWLILLLLRALFPAVVLFGLPQLSENLAQSIGNIPSYFADRDALTQELTDLRFQNTILQRQLQADTFLKEENSELKTLLGSEGSSIKGVLGSVIAWPPKTAYDTLRITVPKDAAVSPGDVVFGQGLVPIARVTKRDNTIITATLFSSPDVTTEVRLGEERFPVQLVGQGGGAASIVVPKELPARIGDGVFFPYNGNTFMGTVGSIVTNVSSPTKELWVVFPRNLFAHTWVSIKPFTDTL